MLNKTHIFTILSLFSLINFPVVANMSEKNSLLIVVSISEQKLYLYEKDTLISSYPISTSKFGIGNQQDSNKTPLGKHKIAKKIGKDAPLNTIFIARRQMKKTAVINEEQGDVITSRILWLKGLEKGKNKGKGIDSYKRYIYIHGTAEEKAIGRPASHGCVRMLNSDVVTLFEQVSVNTQVMIQE